MGFLAFDEYVDLLSKAMFRKVLGPFQRASFSAM
jgi:hypothetical protein